jgi:hypothetical protein
VSVERSSLIARLWLTIIVIGQIIITPIVAFSITYLLEFDKTADGFSLNFQQSMIPWIISASLAYGMLALFLALLMGGFVPRFVTLQGGWLRALGLIRGRRQSDAVLRAKLKAYHSPQGKMVRVVSDRKEAGHHILSIHGGLVLLAIPFQLIMVVVPLATILFIPKDWMAPNTMLEFSLVSYVVILISVMQIFPKFAKKFVTAAAFTRRWLKSMTRLSWLAPILVLWLLGRMASVIVVTWIGPDIGASIAVEKALFEDWLGIGTVPENSFLDLLTALAVMPLSAFTTLATLGGANGPLPVWMNLEKGDGWESPEDDDEDEDGGYGSATGDGIASGGILGGSEAVSSQDEDNPIFGDDTYYSSAEDGGVQPVETDGAEAEGIVSKGANMAAGMAAGAGLVAGTAWAASKAVGGASAEMVSNLSFEPEGTGLGDGIAESSGGSDLSDDGIGSEVMMSLFERFD